MSGRQIIDTKNRSKICKVEVRGVQVQQFESEEVLGMLLLIKKNTCLYVVARE